MKLTVVGCSPAWPNPGGAHSGYLLEHDGARLLLDCGPGVLSRLREREGWPRIDAIVISHFHLDHFGDLIPWMYGATMGPGSGCGLWIAPGGRDHLPQEMDDVFAIREYTGPFDAAGFAITPFRMQHYSQPTWGLRIEAGGKVLAYSADASPTPELNELARDADLFLCEATLGEDETDREPRGHMKASEAVAVALNASPKRMLLIHRPAELPSPEGIELAHDGLELKL